MNFLYKLEKRFGRFAIRHLMRYVLGLYIIGYIIYFMSVAMNFDIYGQYLMLDIDKVLSGQIWRIFTFLIQPPDVSVLFLIFFLYLYYMIGEALEAVWGSFIFNMYFLLGVIFNILSVVIIYAVTKSIYGVGYSYPITLTYINQSLFFAFAALYPNTQLLLFFFIPIKVKWLGIFEGVLMGYQVLKCVVEGVRDKSILSVAMGVSIAVAMANFLIFFLITRHHKRISPQMARTRSNYRRTMNRSREDARERVNNGIARHKCAICGRTELDDDTLEFRYCSRCVGNYEYCSEHLYTHTHVGYMTDPNNVTNGGNGGFNQ